MKKGNFTPSTLFALIVFPAFLGTSTTYAQKATEVFIPIGQSPGLSAKHTTIGTIDSLNMKGEAMTVSHPGGTYMIRFTKNTKVYVDRSSSGKPNSKGTISDCKKGMMVEVKYVDNKVGSLAEWIKVKGKEEE